MDIFKKKMENSGYKNTPQRAAIYEIIKNSDIKHMTAEEIYNVVKSEYRGIGIATVYRTLQMLEKIGIIKKDYISSGVVRYELADLDGLSHHHMVCQKCGIILEAKEDLVGVLEKIIERDYGFQVTDHNIKFIGYCKNCKS